MSDTCEDCERIRSDASQLMSTGWEALECDRCERARLQTLLDRYRALAKAADAMYTIGLRATDEWNGYAADRAAVREVEEGSPKRPDDSDT